MPGSGSSNGSRARSSSSSSSWSPLDILDSLSDTILGCLLVTCALAFCGCEYSMKRLSCNLPIKCPQTQFISYFSVIYVIVYAVNNPICVSDDVTHSSEMHKSTSPDIEVIISLSIWWSPSIFNLQECDKPFQI